METLTIKQKIHFTLDTPELPELNIGKNNDDEINPDDYADDTDYINAIPGMKERLLKSLNAPASEFKPAPRKYFNV
ncbi:hypothetical protein R80B4_02482 [Fibrobacteres bacterium R8-0-B4]